MADEKVGVEVQVQVDGAKTLSTLKKDLKEAQGQAIALSREFGENSKEALAAVKRVAMLKDEMGDLNERVQLFDPGAKFKAFGNVVTSVTAGFSAAQGALAIFGGESEDLQKQLVKLQGAMNLSQGLSSIFDAGKSFKDLGSIIRDNVVKAFTTFKGALAATGLGLIVLAIGALATNFESVEKWIKKIIPGFDGFAASFGKIKAVAFGVLNGIIESFKVVGEIIGKVFDADFSGALDSAKNAGARIGAAYNEGFEEEVKDQADAAARDIIQKQIDADKVRLRLLRAGGEARAKEAEAAEKEIARKTIDAQKAGSKEQVEAIVAFAELVEKQKAENAKKAKDEAKKAADKRKADGEKALQDLIAQQDSEYARTDLAGQNIWRLKQKHLLEQKKLYEQYGLDLKAFQIKQDAEELERRTKLNGILQANITNTTGIISAGLQNVGAAQEQFNTRVNEGAANGANAVDEAERRKQAAMQATNDVLSPLIEERESMSDLEKGAVIATMIATEFAEAGKRSALELTQSALRIAAKVLGEQSALGKGVAIANTTIDTIKSASGVFSGMVSTIPGPIGIALGVAGAAAAVIAGIARVKQITAVKIPGAGGAGGSAPSISEAAAGPAMPRVQGNTGVMVDQLDQLNSNMRQPQRIVVVESDITNTQDRVATIEESATF